MDLDNQINHWYGLIQRNTVPGFRGDVVIVPKEFTRPGFLVLNSERYNLSQHSLELVLEEKYEPEPNRITETIDPGRTKIVIPFSKLSCGTHRAYVFVKDENQRIAYDTIDIKINKCNGLPNIY